MHHPTRLRFAGLLTTFLVMSGLVLTATSGERADAAPTPPDGPEPNLDYVFELEPGEDLDHWVDFALDTAGVPTRDRPGRIQYKYEEAINGAWLKLTAQEAKDIDAIRGREGVRSLTRSGRMTVEWLQDDVIVAGTDGRVPAWPDQVTPAGVARVDGGNDFDYSGVHVGIIDTGIDRFHDDLNVVGGFDCTFEGHEDDWGYDGNGHGTHTAGTVAALDNDRGVIGVAPGASLHAYKVLGATGGGSYAAVLCGWDRAMIDDVDVVNASLGGGCTQSVRDSWDSLHTGIANAADAGIVSVVAAGNEAADASGKCPASYEEAVTVSALATFGIDRPGENPPPFGCAMYPQKDNELAWFSNNGSLVDVIAPGVCVLSTLPGDNYGVGSGTSMASPHAAGVVAAGVACGYPDVLAYAETYNAAWGGDVDYDREPLAVVPEGC